MTIQANVEIGSDFLGYRIEEVIGSGGMGVVYRAFDLRLKRIVALKFLVPELAQNERFRSRFTRETELAMALEHPNVVPIHDAGDVDGRLYLAMRLVEGTDLRALLCEEVKLDPERTLAICRHVANALDAAHAKGLVHRDVKPSNVLLDPNEHVYLADFGLTRRFDEQDLQAGDGRSIGTPAYLAPEQIEGGPIDGRADVYSLGCLMFECLTGAAPFRGSRLAVAWAHLEDEPPAASTSNSGLPVALDAVLRKAMAKEPDVRYPTCGALVTAAEEALGVRRTPVLARRPIVLAGLAGIAVIVLLAAALAAVLATQSGGGRRPPPPVRANTVVRLDPRTNAVTRVVHVSYYPMAVAAAGQTVWTYDEFGSVHGSVSQIDARSGRRHTAALPARPTDLGLLTGPVLAADPGGAWIVGVDDASRGFLMRLTAGGTSVETFRLDVEPRGVALGEGAVWVLGRSRRGIALLRIDPRTGAATARVRFPTSSAVDSVEVGLGAVYAMASSTATLYRIDPRSARVTTSADLGERAGRVVFAVGRVWVSLSDARGYTALVDPRTLTSVEALGCCALRQDAQESAGFGSVWTNVAASGNTIRWNAETKNLAHVFHLTDPPSYGGHCLTALAAGAGGVWVTVAPATAAACPR